VLDESLSVGEALERLQRSRVPGAPVIDAQRHYVGVVQHAKLLELAEAPEGASEAVGRAADTSGATSSPETNASEALGSMATSDVRWLPVLDDRRRVVGVLTAAELVRGYRGVLWSSLRRITALGNGTAAVDGVVGEHSPLAGRSLADAELPPGTVVLAVTRGPELLAPSGETVLAAGDGVSVLVPRDERAAIDRLLAGEEPAS
jgi:CIC family chloride channel protein